MNLTKEEKNEINRIFEKKFFYVSQSDCKWPWPSLASSTSENDRLNEEFSQLRDELNNCKDSLSDKDIKAWHAHTTATNLAGNVCFTLRSNFKPELCTQAWCKFYEILWSYPVITFEDFDMYTVHLCEAPGAFITCLNHYLTNTAFTGKWRWIGTTLNPYYEGNDLAKMIIDDRLIRNTLPNWFFGDGTGNIMEKNNFKQFLEFIGTDKNVKLVTADGSIDCQNNPAEQESIVSHLHLCEVFTALNILSKGGSFVIKFFTMFEPNSIGLIYLLVKYFEKVNVFKPATSKQGNSEVYVVCLKYHGLEACPKPEMLEELQELIFNNSSIPDRLWDMSSIPESFLDLHLQCCRLLTDWQESVIKNNLRLYPCSIPMKKKLEVRRNYCCREYLYRYPCHKIPNSNRLVNPQNLFVQSDDFLASKFQTKHKGTFTERIDYLSLVWKDKLKHFDLEEYKPLENSRTLSFMKTQSSPPRRSSQLKFLIGKPFSEILSSRHCCIKLLNDINTIFENCDCSAYLHQQRENLCMSLETTLKSLLKSPQKPFPLCSPLCSFSNQGGFFNETSFKELDLIQVNSAESLPSSSFTLFINGTSSLDFLGKGEIKDKRILLSKIIFALQNLKAEDDLIILTHTLITRFNAGLILLTKDCFKNLQFYASPAGLTLCQLLVFSRFLSCPADVAKHLQTIGDWYEAAEQPSISTLNDCDILEVISAENTNEDISFYNVVIEQNGNVMKSFLYSVLSLEKERFSVEG